MSCASVVIGRYSYAWDLQQLDELPLEVGLGLVGRLARRLGDELRDHGALRRHGDRCVMNGAALDHATASANVRSLSR